tara:strand:+ start:773 stop:913 length:141 start_codon:yes stop_codon:yes gene_type:complete
MSIVAIIISTISLGITFYIAYGISKINKKVNEHQGVIDNYELKKKK